MDFLRLDGYNETVLSAVKVSSENDCIDKIEEYKFDFYEDLQNFLRNNKKYSVHSDCMLTNLKTLETFNLMFYASFYSRSFLIEDEEEYMKLQREVREKLYKKLSISDRLCDSHDFHLKQFKELVTPETYNGETGESLQQLYERDYCVKKYFLDQNWIESSYQLNMNPHNIELRSLNCDEYISYSKRFVLEVVRKQFDHKLNVNDSKWRRCISNKKKLHDFYKNFMRVSVLAGSNLTESQLIKERIHFIASMTIFDRNVIKC